MFAKVAVLLAVVACASAQLRYQQQYQQPQQYQQQYQQAGAARQAAIVAQSNEINPDGSFQYSFQSDDGIAAQAQGSVRNAGRGAEGEAPIIQGQFQYTAPDGTPISVTYVADENGYQPQGAHLPTPPPIPEAILRSLEFNARNPEPEERFQGQAQPQAQAFFQPARPVFQAQQAFAPARRF